MRSERKKKVPVNQPPIGLNTAFSELEIAGLPQGHEESISAEPKSPQQIWKMGRVVLRKETAGRGGKAVVVVHDFATHLPVSVIEAIAKKLRQACGCGGTVRGRTIEVQGDQPSKVRSVLEREGFQVAGIR